MQTLWQNKTGNTQIKQSYSTLSTGKKRKLLHLYKTEFGTCCKTFYNKLNADFNQLKKYEQSWFLKNIIQC